MATVQFEFHKKADHGVHVVKGAKHYILYVMDDASIIDPFGIRPTTQHASVDAAISVASHFADNKFDL